MFAFHSRRRFTLSISSHFFLLSLASHLLFSPSFAQQAVEHRQVSLAKWGIGTGNFSGITPLGGDRYAVVSDKEPADGYFVLRIRQDSIMGNVEDVELEAFHGNPSPLLDEKGLSLRDCEDIAFFPAAGTLFISGEGDQRILEYDDTGRLTGRELAVPQIFSRDRIVGNYGFEALTYSPANHCFWTITESTLPADGPCASPQNSRVQNLLRLQAFGDDLQPLAQYAYRADMPKIVKYGSTYAMGGSAITPLPDGDLLVLERELNVLEAYFGSTVECKIFRISPNSSWQIDGGTQLSTLDPNKFVVKRLVANFTTKITPVRYNFANYEGMCLGRRLSDGRQTVLLINDSQAAVGRRVVHLKDYIKVLIVE